VNWSSSACSKVVPPAGSSRTSKGTGRLKRSPVTHATTFPYLEPAPKGLTDPIEKSTSVTVA
jgi:hypothetical protein